jgi:hypothetical protein
MRRFLSVFSLAVCLLGARSTFAFNSISCRDIFSDENFKKLTITSTYLIHGKQSHESISGTIDTVVDGENFVSSVKLPSPSLWPFNNKKNQKPIKFEYTSDNLETIPAGAEILFTNPTNEQLTCNCSFYFIRRAPTDPIYCNTIKSSDKNGYTPAYRTKRK